MAIKCHYCDNKDLKKYAWAEDKVYAWYCEPCEKTTSQMHVETCLGCRNEFEFLYDAGWNEAIICFPCRQKALKDFLDDPEMKKAFEKAMQEPNPYLPKGDSGFGGYIPVPVVYKKFDANG